MIGATTLNAAPNKKWRQNFFEKKKEKRYFLSLLNLSKNNGIKCRFFFAEFIKFPFYFFLIDFSFLIEF